MSRKRIRKVLVANRGEIARRVMRTCHRMGIGTVAVFSDADADAPFVREADEAVRIGPPPSVESYLAIERIVEAATRTGADAVHPGYGFLAENADFAEACTGAGLVFIGPTASAIRAMGSKREAKRLVAAAGVPVIPGYDGEDQDPATLAAKAVELGFPVLLKASAGGGGKGMRIVRETGELQAAIESARRESEGAFGDGTLLVERYLEEPRHVEFQILGDADGTVIHLFERECSIQRRHQKIVEESPSPALTAAMRAQMGEAAVTVGRAIGYQNAGTVEFVLANDGSFHFLEVNTRLQVEHPVTEMVTGLDLVHEQIRLAEGEALGFGQEELELRGAAVEVRLYAEDPSQGFLPASGHIVDWHVPEMEGLRVDAGVETGSEVSIHYDPMLAKVVTHGIDRAEALQKMSRALRGLSISGVRTNRAFLLDVLEHPEFVAGRIDTHFIDKHLAEVLAVPPSEDFVHRAAVAATLMGHELRRRRMPPPRVLTGWRNSRFRDQFVELLGPSGTLRVDYRDHGGGRFDVRIGDESRAIRVIGCDGPEIILEEDGLRRRARVIVHGALHHVHGADGDLTLRERPRFPAREEAVVSGGCTAPMPGRIIEVRASVGDRVEKGAALLVMEAMKMEHTVTAPHAGTVSELRVAKDDQVDADQLLAVVDASQAGD